MYLVSYFKHKALAFEHVGSVHCMWHMHFVANTLDSSHGICNATIFFGNVLKLYSTTSPHMVRTHTPVITTNKNKR